MIGFSRDELLSIGQQISSNIKLPGPVMCRIRHLNLNVIPATERGKRAGKHKQRIINTVVNISFDSFHRSQTEAHPNHLISLNPHDSSNISSEQHPISTICGNRPEVVTSANGVNKTNLVNVDIQQKAKPPKKLSFGYMNARSVKNKASEINDFIVDNNLDICSLSETWLQSGSQHDVACGELIPACFAMKHVPRTTARGGGVAVVFKSSIKVKKEKVKQFSSFEVIELLLNTRNDSLRLCVIYRPPPGGKCSKPVSVFLSEFEEYIANNSLTTGKLLVVGDFNFHLDVLDNNDSHKFKTLLFSLNLEQHVQIPTHQHGHTLDLVIT